MVTAVITPKSCHFPTLGTQVRPTTNVEHSTRAKWHFRYVGIPNRAHRSTKGITTLRHSTSTALHGVFCQDRHIWLTRVCSQGAFEMPSGANQDRSQFASRHVEPTEPRAD
jgi:hypothetical protein